MFKKSRAVTVDKMNQLKDVVVTEEQVRFNLTWSDIKLKPQDIPGLLSDVIQLYAFVKPTLEKLNEERQKEQNGDESKTSPSDEPINLDDIPF